MQSLQVLMTVVVTIKIDFTKKIQLIKDLRDVYRTLAERKALPVDGMPIKVDCYSDDNDTKFTLYLPHYDLNLREAKQIAELFFPDACNRMVDELGSKHSIKKTCCNYHETGGLTYMECGNDTYVPKY